MGFKRKREGYQDQRPKLSPTEQLVARIRPSIAQIGEPSRYAREGLMRSLMHDLGEVPESHFGDVLETIKAVIYEQPHKIGFLSFVVVGAPSHVSFLIVEMAHDEATTALAKGEYTRFKLFFRFLCAVHPIIANPEVLSGCLTALLDFAGDAQLKTELYKTALLASLYLPKSFITPDLRQKFVDAQLDGPRDLNFFDGPSQPYKTRYDCDLLVEAARKLNEVDWQADILAANPLKPEKAAEGAGENGDKAKTEDDAYVPAGDVADSDVKRESASEASAEPAAEPAAEPSAEPAAEPSAEPSAEPTESVEPKAEPSAEPTKESSEPAPGSSEPAVDSEEPKKLEPEQIKHTLRSIHLTSPLPAAVDQPHTPAFFRCYMPIEGVETVPSEDSVAGLLLRDVAIDNIRHMDFNRREVTRQLIALDVFFSRNAFAPPGAWLDQVAEAAREGKPTWKVEDIALEAVFSQMFDLANTAQLPLVYYHSLLIEACIMAPQDIAPVLGRGLRFLFNALETADAELLFRLVDWFAHHVSNFAFTWKWNEWKDALSLPEDHPQLVFIRELLAKEVRLSYPQRVRDILPDEFQGLVPTPPDMPPFKFSEQEKGEALVSALRAGEYEQAKQTLNDIEEKTERVDLLVHTICHLGNRSVTHATTWIAKTEALINEFANKDDGEVAPHVVSAVFEHWLQAPWVGALVINQFIRAQLVHPSVFVQHIVSSPNLLLSSLGWETLVSYIPEAKAALADVKLEGAYADWWTQRLQKAVFRVAQQADEQAERAAKKEAEARQAQLRAEEEKAQAMEVEAEAAQSETKDQADSQAKDQADSQTSPAAQESLDMPHGDSTLTSENIEGEQESNAEPVPKRQKTG